MEWYTLNDQLKRETVIEGFQSFIWAERYSAAGDFEIITPATSGNRRLFQPGLRIAMNHSSRVMTVETVLDSIADDGTKSLKITGPSIEDWLDDRAGMEALASLTTASKWTLTGTPGDICRSMFNKVCVLKQLNANDGLPFYTSGTFLPAGSIAEPEDIVTIDFEFASLYANIKSVCDTWVLGFRLVRNGDTGQVYFDIYTGDDRTTAQDDRAAVVFTPDMETLVKSSSVRSIAPLKTVALVLAQNGAMEVYAAPYSATSPPDQRRVLIVKADDLDLPAGADLDKAMALKGKIELAKNTDAYALDGEIPWHQPYIYGIDYNLGDLVEERSPDGGTNYMLVTEQIFMSDEQGQRTYPTLSVSHTVSPGSWESLPESEHWGDIPITTHWDDL